MRKHRLGKYSGLIVAALMLGNGCWRSEEPAVGETPQPASASSATTPISEPTPDPVRDLPRQGLVVSNGRVLRPHTADGDEIGDVPTAVLRRLVYQCSDEVTFAVRIAGDRIEVFPPGISKSYVSLTRIPTDVGVRYVAMGADFRGNGDLATLQVGADRYVDCVSNPAAEVWGTVEPTITR